MHILAIALLSTVSVLQPAAQPDECEAPDPTQIGKFEVENDLFLPHFDLKTDIDTRQRVHVVQPSDWNEESTTAEDLRYVKEHASYHKIPDGNAGGNGTPKLRASEPVDWQRHIQAPALAEIWRLAIEIANTYNGTENRYTTPAIADGGLDFSNTVETCWIFDHDDLADAEAFFKAFETPSE